jgi:hypothetical protein
MVIKKNAAERNHLVAKKDATQGCKPKHRKATGLVTTARNLIISLLCAKSQKALPRAIRAQLPRAAGILLFFFYVEKQS